MLKASLLFLLLDGKHEATALLVAVVIEANDEATVAAVVVEADDEGTFFSYE